MQKYFILMGCVFLWNLWGCSGEKEDDLIDILEKETIGIQDYLRENSTTPVTKVCFYSVKGLPIDTVYIFNNDATGTVVKEYEHALIDYDVLDLKGKYVDSTDPEQKLDSNYAHTYVMGGPVYNALDTANKYNYIGEALKHIGEGKTGEMIVPSKLGNQNGKSLVYKLKAKRVIPDFKVYEQDLMQSYIDQIDGKIGDPIVMAQGDTVGYLVLTRRGTGERAIQEGDNVSVSHEAYVFTENLLKRYEVWDSVSFVHSLTISNGRMLPSYAKALTYLHYGDEAAIILPHTLGYGKAGMLNASKQVLIPSYSTLVFTMQIKRVEVPPAPENTDSEKNDQE